MENTLNRAPLRALASGLLLAAVGAAAWFAISRMLLDLQTPDWTALTVLMLLACGTAPLRFPMPGIGRSTSISFWFVFAAITEETAIVALFIAGAVQVFDLLINIGDPVEEREETFGQVGFQFALTAVCIGAASAAHSYLSETVGVAWAVTSLATAAVYYAVWSGFGALRTALQEGASPRKIWNERFFWSSPVFLLAPAGISVAKLLVEAESYIDSLLGLTVILGGYTYMKTYFPRLQDREDHAQRTAEIRQRALETLAVAIEAKDGSTAGHLQRVKLYAARLARRLGCTEEEIRALEMAAVLHDVGKVGVPDYILKKPGRLTAHEFDQISRHAIVGSEIVRTMQFTEPVEEIVLSHHEHWDGSGYPRKLRGEEIPLLARVLTVVDCFDALISERPYRQALPIEEAVEVMRRQRGCIFDPRILDAFLAELPSYLQELEAQLEREREGGEAEESAAAPVMQTWLDEADARARSTQHQALRRLTQSPDLLYAFYEILRTLGADLNYEEGLHRALRILRKTCGAHKALLFRLCEDRYVLAAADGLPQHCISRLTLSAQHGLVAHAAITHMPLMADAPPSEVPDGPVPRYLEDIQATLAAPLVLGEQVTGVLVLGAPHKAAFHEEQAQFLTLLTEKLAATLLSGKQIQRLHLDAQTDPVTHLPNARAVFERLDSEIARASRDDDTVGVLFMDLDGLKPVNDAHGHAAGDRLLTEVAQRLRRSLRGYDFVGRMGGDEFLAVLPGISREALEGQIEALRRSVASRPVALGPDCRTYAKISIGAAIYPFDGQIPDDLVYLSDQRMYRDKQRRRPMAVVSELTPTPSKGTAFKARASA